MLKRLRAVFNRELTRTKDNPFRILVYAFAAIGYVSTLEKAYAESREIYLALVAASIIATLWIVFFVRIDYVGRIEPETPRKPGKPAVRPADADADKRYRITVPAMRQTAEGVIEKSQKIFGGDAIDPDEDMQNFLNDPYSLIALIDRQQNIQGFIDFYAFKTEHYQLFINGEFDFDELLAHSLINHPQARRATAVHISTLVNMSYLLDSLQRQRSRENRIMIWAVAEAILAYQHFPPQGLDLYSIGWSPSGEKAMRMFGFRQVGHVLKGSSLGKPIYALKNVHRPQLQALADRGREDYSDWCDLRLAPVAEAGD